jgi:hypothetical protein
MQFTVLVTYDLVDAQPKYRALKDRLLREVFLMDHWNDEANGQDIKLPHNTLIYQSHLHDEEVNAYESFAGIEQDFQRMIKREFEKLNIKGHFAIAVFCQGKLGDHSVGGG